MPNKFQLPPISNEIIFEEFVCELYNLEYPDSSFEPFGKRGNKQDGIDLLSVKKRIAIQCKKTEIHRDPKKVLSKLKEQFKACVLAAIEIGEDLDEIIFVSTYSDSSDLVKYLIELKKTLGVPFVMSYQGWESLQSKAQKYHSMLVKYYPILFDSVTHRTRTPFFDPELLEGRTEMLKQIDEFVNKYAAVVLLGVGGIGKSVTLSSYLREKGKQYRSLIWIEVQLDSLRGDVSSRLSGIFSESDEREKRYLSWEILMQKMIACKGENLIVIDGIEFIDDTTSSVLDDLCSTGWKVIVTSRVKIPDYPFLNFSGISEESALAVFKRHFKKEKDDVIAREILHKLEFHPLLIELLAKAGQANPSLTLRGLLELLKDEALEDVALQQLVHIGRHSRKYSDKYEHKVFKYLLLCFNLNTLSKEELKQLNYFSVLPHSEAISYDFYLSITDQKSTNKNIRTLNALVSKGFISDRDGHFSIHTIVQVVIRKKLEMSVSKVQNIALNCTVALKAILDVPSATLMSYIIIARNILNLEPLQAHTLYLAQFYSLSMVRMGEYVRAIKYSEECINFLEENEVDDLSMHSSFLNNLGIAYGYVGKYEQAMACLSTSLKWKVNLGEDEEISLAVTLDNLATQFEKVGRYHEAKELTLRAVAVFEHYACWSKLGIAYTNVANSYILSLQFKKALRYWKKGLTIMKKNYQPDNLHFADSYNTAGLIYLRQNEPIQAKKYYIKALEIYKKENNPHILSIGYANIGLCEVMLCELDQAKIHLERALEFQKMILNGGADDIAPILLNFGNYYIARENPKAALKSFKEAVKIYENRFGDHPSMDEAKEKIRQLKSPNALIYCHRIKNGYIVTIQLEILKANLKIQRKIVDKYGKILYLKSNKKEDITFDYLLFLFAKSTKTIESVLTLIRRNLSEDAMTLLYSVYRGYLTIEFVGKHPELTQIILMSNTSERRLDENGVLDALTFILDKEERDVYPRLFKMVGQTSCEEDKAVHAYLEPHLSDHAFSNFITAGTYRGKNNERYIYKNRELIYQAASLCNYLQFVTIDTITKYLLSRKVKVKGVGKQLNGNISRFNKMLLEMNTDQPEISLFMQRLNKAVYM